MTLDREALGSWHSDTHPRWLSTTRHMIEQASPLAPRMLWSSAPTSIHGHIRPLIGPNEGLWRARDGVRPCPVARGARR